jgi:inosose dehydratase
MIEVLEARGYDGWYVLEQDVMLDGEPADEGPVANVRASLDYLERFVT